MALWRTNGHRPVVHAGISPGTSGAESRSSAYSIERMIGVEVGGGWPGPAFYAFDLIWHDDRDLRRQSLASPRWASARTD